MLLNSTKADRCASQAECIMPEEVYMAVRETLQEKNSSLHYATVIIPLGALLEKDFFSTYVKNGTSSKYHHLFSRLRER